ncbi:type II/IV secretion system ATPase subunit [Candidatus Micrarchaeota archaeon]|nr:type II/IV secretion system ATPase subunit [Candidatus Micrarchaeota archaeon]
MAIIKTKIDEMCIHLEQHSNGLTFSELASYLKIDEDAIQNFAEMLESIGAVSIDYSPLSGNKVSLKQKKWMKIQQKTSGKVIDEYILNVKGITADVEIKKPEDSIVHHYILTITDIGPYTQTYLEAVRDKISRIVVVSPEDLMNSAKTESVYSKFQEASKPFFETLNISKEKIDILTGSLLIKMYGLGELEFLLVDNDLEEVCVNGAGNPVGVYHKRFGWCKTNIIIATEEEVFEYSAQVARRSGRDITLLSPIMDAHLETGDRVAATLFPITSSGNTITIRKFARKPWTITDFIDPSINTLDVETAAFLWAAVQYELNILVAGGSASGKTSMLNTLVSLIPANQRIVSIEDTREINLPHYSTWNWIPMTTRASNVENKGEVTMIDLMQSSLRLRPERMIVGEVRRPLEAHAMFEAMQTGHSVYSTMHAQSAEQVLRRLSSEPFNIPSVELQSLHIITVQYRDRKTGRRRTSETSEVLSTKSETLPLNKVYLWHPRSDKFEKLSESIRVFEELNLYTGMTPKEISADLKDKIVVLDWMLKKGVKDVDSVGAVVNAYYTSPEKAIKLIKSKAPAQKVLSLLKE